MLRDVRPARHVVDSFNPIGRHAMEVLFLRQAYRWRIPFPFRRNFDTRDKHSLAILRKPQTHCVNQTPFNGVIKLRERIQNRCEMSALLHMKETLDILEHKIPGRATAENIDDGLKQCSSRILGSLFFPRAAEGLAWESACQQVVFRNFVEQSLNRAFANLAISETAPVNPAGFGAQVVGPNRLDMKTIRCHPKSTDPGEQLDRP